MTHIPEFVRRNICRVVTFLIITHILVSLLGVSGKPTNGEELQDALKVLQDLDRYYSQVARPRFGKRTQDSMIVSSENLIPGYSGPVDLQRDSSGRLSALKGDDPEDMLNPGNLCAYPEHLRMLFFKKMQPCVSNRVYP